jgi:hypothetical protein
LTICNIEIEGSVIDLEFDEKLNKKLDECDLLTDNCNQYEAETKFSCLERYGVNKTSSYCSEFSKSTSDSFYYPLKHKYDCLTDPENDFTDADDITIDDHILSCLQVYYDYPVELCLEA